MTPETLPFDPQQTVAATWRRRLAGPNTEEKTHWRTKIAYYRAVDELVSAHPDQPLTWRSIVDTVRPKGSRSTFYEVTGPRSKRALVAAFVSAAQPESYQLAVCCYRRPSAVEQLVDETKVWSYWPYRQGWLDQWQASPDLGTARATQAMVAVVQAWARQCPQLAAALDYAPPACAVEDLVMVNQRRLSAVRAFDDLRTAVVAATGASGDLLDGVPDTAADGVRPPAADALVVRLAEQIYAVSREVDRPMSRSTVISREASALMADAVTHLG